MKRILAIVLSLAMILVVFLMAGCGGDPDETTGSTGTSTSSTSGTSDTTNSTEPSETTGSSGETTDSSSDTEPTSITYTGFEKPYGFEDVDFGGDTFVIVADDASKDGWDASKEIYSDGTDPISVAVRLRNDTMAKLYNCTIRVEATPSDNVGTLISADVTGNQHNYDMYTIKYGSKSTSEAGNVYNLYNLGINFENEWWDQNWVDTYSIKKSDGTLTLYTVLGDFALSSFSATHAIMMNKTVYDNAGFSEDVYQLVRDRKWTMDKFVEMAKAAAHENSGNSELHYSEGDIMGWVRTGHATHGLHAASGLSMVTNDNGAFVFELANNTTAWSDVITKAIEVWAIEEAETIPYTDVQTAVSSGKTLFGSEVLDVLERMKDVEGLSVGLLPYPLYSETQENYAHYVDNHVYCYAVPTSVPHIETMGEFMELFGFHSQYIVRTAWIETYSYEYCNDIDSAEMLEIILNTRTYDPGYLYFNWEGEISNMIDTGKNNVVKFTGRYESIAATAFETYVNNISKNEA